MRIPLAMKCLPLAILLFYATHINAQSKEIDSLKNRLMAEGRSEQQIGLLNDLSFAYASLDFQISLYYAKRAQSIADSTGNVAGQAGAANKIGNAYYFSNIFDTALIYHNKSLELYIELGDSSQMAQVLTDIGQVYYYSGEYDKATEKYFESLKISEAAHAISHTAEALNCLGQIYQAQGQSDAALDYYQQALANWRSVNERNGEAQTLNSIGNVYYSLHQPNDALKYYLEAVAIMDSLGKQRSVATITGNIGAVYGEIGQYDAAITYFLKSYAAQVQLSDSSGMSNSLSNIGLVYLHKNDYPNAQKYIEQSLQIARRTGNKKLIANIYNDLASTYAEKKEFENAFLYYRKYSELRDTLLMESSSLQIAEMGEKYKSVKQEEQIRILEKDKEKQKELADAENRRKNVIIIAVIIVLVLVVAFSLLLFNRFRTIQHQKSIIEAQKNLVEEKNKDITDSINYAKRIQRTLLASDQLLKRNLADHFVFYEPKEIVSGDFYWATEKDGRFYLAVCDSTGHGVPGAFMSILNISFLNEAINEKGIIAPSEILNYVRRRLIENVSQDGGKDGMDGILLCIDQNTKGISYSAAYNRPIVVKETAIELNADKMPIGLSDHEHSFTDHVIENIPGCMLYLGTDGYADQFGGPRGKKFMYKQFNELVQSASAANTEEQKKIISGRLHDWKGKLEQVDDVLVIGIRLQG